MNHSIQTTTIPHGKSADIVGGGKFFKLLRVTTPSLINLQSGIDFPIVQGEEIEFEKQIESGKLTAPGAIADVQVTYYIGDFPFAGLNMVEPNGTLATGDWITLAPVGGGYFVTLNGTMIVNGTTYRRKNITLMNLSGSNYPGVNVAALITVQGSRSATAAMKATGGALAFNGGSLVLPSGNGNVLTPITLETDDNLVVSSIAASDLAIFQTWIPVIT